MHDFERINFDVVFTDDFTGLSITFFSSNISKGHFGQVARAEYHEKFVAVKILLPSAADRGTRERQNFINEALLLRQYKHKNIVKFLGIAAIRDPLMIMMELIERM